MRCSCSSWQFHAILLLPENKLKVCLLIAARCSFHTLASHNAHSHNHLISRVLCDLLLFGLMPVCKDLGIYFFKWVYLLATHAQVDENSYLRRLKTKCQRYGASWCPSQRPGCVLSHPLAITSLLCGFAIVAKPPGEPHITLTPLLISWRLELEGDESIPHLPLGQFTDKFRLVSLLPSSVYNALWKGHNFQMSAWVWEY